MISDFVERKLAEVDDLAELKVTLVALRLLEQKVAPAASTTERELLAHPAIRDGLSFPAISLRPALQRAVARGTLLCAQVADEPRYFAADDASRRAVEALSVVAAPESVTNLAEAVLRLVAGEIERLEQIDAYAISGEDGIQIEEWLARGYTHEEIISATCLALRSPRGKHVPPRGVKEIGTALTAARRPAQRLLRYRCGQDGSTAGRDRQSARTAGTLADCAGVQRDACRSGDVWLARCSGWTEARVARP